MVIFDQTEKEVQTEDIETKKSDEAKLLASIFCKNPTLCKLSSSSHYFSEPTDSLVAKRKWVESQNSFCTKCRCLSDHCSKYRSHINSGLYLTTFFQQSRRALDNKLRRREAKEQKKERIACMWPPVRTVKWSGNRTTWPKYIAYNFNRSDDDANNKCFPKLLDIMNRQDEENNLSIEHPAVDDDEMSEDAQCIFIED